MSQFSTKRTQFIEHKKKTILRWLINAIQEKNILFPQERYFVPTIYYFVPTTYYLVPSIYYYY